VRRPDTSFKGILTSIVWLSGIVKPQEKGATKIVSFNSVVHKIRVILIKANSVE
jgi:hypothetical protein